MENQAKVLEGLLKELAKLESNRNNNVEKIIR